MEHGSTQEFLGQAFPQMLRIELAARARRAYRTAARLAEDTGWLRHKRATFERGHLVAWAMDAEMVRLCETGPFGLRCEWESFGAPVPTGYYLKIFGPHVTLSVSQVSDPDRKPRRADFRNNAALNNQPFLFPDMAPAVAEAPPHVLIIHGRTHSLEFLHGAIPHPSRRRSGYVDKTANLLSLPYVVGAEHPGFEGDDEEPPLELIRDIADRRGSDGG